MARGCSYLDARLSGAFTNSPQRKSRPTARLSMVKHGARSNNALKRGFLWKFLAEEIFSVSLFIGRVNRKGRVTAGQIADCGFPLPRWQRYFEFIFKNTRRHSNCPYGNKRNLNEISAHLENLFGGDTKRSLAGKRGMKRHRQLREEGSGNAGRSPPHRAERDARKGTPIRATRPNTIRSTR